VRLRLLAALAGLGALVACPVARALVPPEGPDEAPVSAPAADALALLRGAAAAARESAWSGTERVLSMATGAPVVSVTTVEHGPGRHSPTEVLDDRLFSLLASHYDLRVMGTGRSGDHLVRSVEATRRDTGAVAARFWVDLGSGLLVRRDVLDRAGQLLRRTELLSVRPAGAAPVADAVPSSGEHLDSAALAELESDGWPVLRALPGSLDLYDARWLPDGVLQLAFTDGLTTLSLFVQRGERLPAARGVRRSVAGGTAWETSGEPDRVVWTSGGCTWTLVSDAEPAVVDEVLAGLPVSRAAVLEEGMAPRVWRGMSRVGAWMNPFD
jgi:sigma-E factor negative regulatory protein RseB